MTTDYIYVFDYSVTGLYEIKLDNPVNNSIEDILKKYGLKASQCSWMITDRKLLPVE